MARTYVVTGAASGIGKATKERLEAAGGRVIGVDLHSAEIEANLATAEGRKAMIDGAEQLSGGKLEGVVACAGLSPGGAGDEVSSRIDNTSPELIIRVNYFGAIATLEGLRPLLARGEQPRAVALCSTGMLSWTDTDSVDALLADEEERAVSIARDKDGVTAYRSAKVALGRWIRRNSISNDWAGAGIPINGVAPGFIITPMSKPVLVLPYEEMVKKFPGFPEMPLHGPGEPEDAAALISWLLSPENVLVTGQVIFIDGGFDVVKRGEEIWPRHSG